VLPFEFFTLYAMSYLPLQDNVQVKIKNPGNLFAIVEQLERVGKEFV